jgi:hypothetical protein
MKEALIRKGQGNESCLESWVLPYTTIKFCLKIKKKKFKKRILFSGVL